MGLLNLNEPEKTEAELSKETKDNGIRVGIVIVCICIAGAYASFTYDPRSGDPVLRGRLVGEMAHLIGATLGMLALPTIAALIGKVLTEKWQYIFGGVFLLIFILNLASRFIA